MRNFIKAKLEIDFRHLHIFAAQQVFSIVHFPACDPLVRRVAKYIPEISFENSLNSIKQNSLTSFFFFLLESSRTITENMESTIKNLNGLPPYSDEGRQGFAYWAANVTMQFKGRGYK